MGSTAMGDDNKSVYESSELARQYGSDACLQAPEQSILEALRKCLSGADMLDVGVGGGRTTGHFAPLVKSYVGIDYSEQMITVCRERFKEIPNRLVFRVADARSMPMFDNHSFDFVFFSYNGLDYVPHEERAVALREIRRILRPGGHFALSTHNLNSLRRRLRPAFNLNPKKAASRFLWAGRFLLHNRKLLNFGSTDYCEVYDGAQGYRLRTHYITPEGALKELERSGFRDTTIFSLATGQPLLNTGQPLAIADDWLYYLSAG
jgi:SAM-dependent methyltransferase